MTEEVPEPKEESEPIEARNYFKVIIVCSIVLGSVIVIFLLVYCTVYVKIWKVICPKNGRKSVRTELVKQEFIPNINSNSNAGIGYDDEEGTPGSWGRKERQGNDNQSSDSDEETQRDDNEDADDQS